MLTFRPHLVAGLILVSLPLHGIAQGQLVRIPLPVEQSLVRQLIAPPFDFVELCTSVKARRVLNWQFEAATPVEFNTHFHLDGAMLFPERMTAVSAAKGRLVPSGDQDYCWMWTNSTSVPVLIHAQFGP